METKIIAMYLPQYHTIPENDKWWGEGYTDWVAVKKSKPLFKNHNQPRIPLNENYYDLTDVNTLRWEAQLAKVYGIDGFGIYHYWFSDEIKLLEKPAEIILQNPDIDIDFFFTWDNGSWKRTWSNVRKSNDWAPAFDKKPHNPEDNGLLAELIYGDEKSWEKHFQYLLPFFKDKRYIKKDNCPIFALFQPDNNFETIKKMCLYWNTLAIREGFAGIFFIFKQCYKGLRLDYMMRYEPLSANTRYELWVNRFHNVLNRIRPKLRIFDYDKIWGKIIRNARHSKHRPIYYGGFTGFDDSPRRGKKARIILGGTPEKFQNYLDQLYSISQSQGKEFIFLTAWNEWGEGAYLEPDTTDGYAYLEAVKAVKERHEKNS